MISDSIYQLKTGQKMQKDDPSTISGIRMTRPRKEIMALFSQYRNGITLQEAIEYLRSNGIGQATIYRTFHLFDKAGIIYPHTTPDGKARYILTRNGYQHLLICKSCGHFQTFESCGLHILEKLLEKETGYIVQGHIVELFGICPSCREKTHFTETSS